MNRKQLALEVCKREGLKEQVNVAQVEEVLKHAFDIMVGLTTGEVALLFKARRVRPAAAGS